MKKTRLFSVLLALVLLLSAVGLFAACRGGEDGPGDGGLVDGKAVVHFDPNLDGTGLFEEDVTSVRDQSVDPGSTIVNMPLTIRGNPANPQNLGFKEWCVDKEGTTPWDFSQPVTQSMTLYAKWESQLVVTYHIGAQTVEENLFSGELATPQDGAASWNRVLGWYTTPTFDAGTEYDFSQPVTTDMDLYCRMATGFYISAERIAGFGVQYGQPGTNLTDTEVEYVEDEDGGYTDVWFGVCENTSYLWYDFGDQATLTDPITGDRTGDCMTITYKNLGAATYMRFYYVVGYGGQFDENGNPYYLYSGIVEGRKYNPNLGGTESVVNDNGVTEWPGLGQWRGGGADAGRGSYVLFEIESNMSASDEWATVTVNLAEETIMSAVAGELEGVSEWGTADVFCVLRWEPLIEENGSYSSNFVGNQVYFKSIEFSPAPAEESDNA